MYDVALSFAGEDRDLAARIAQLCTATGLTVFYDDFARADLWGKDLAAYLDTIYRKNARFCVVLVSADYLRKVWTKHEIRSAFARAMQADAEYLLPVRVDDADLPGLSPTIGYVDARDTAPEEIVRLLGEKVTGVAPLLADDTMSHRSDRVVDEFRQRLDGDGARALLDRETTRLLGVLGDYQVTAVELDPGDLPAEVARRLDEYEREVVRLAHMVVACVSHGDEQTTSWWTRSLTRLLSARRGDATDGIGELVAAQAYPALVVSYSAGIAARLSGHEDAIWAALGKPTSIERLLPFRVVASSVVDEFPGWTAEVPGFGLSVRLRQALAPVFTGSYTDAEYASAFADYEYLRSLLELHALDFSALGEFAVALGRGRSDVDDRVAPACAAGAPLLLAGAFDGHEATAADTRRRLLNLVRSRFG